MNSKLRIASIGDVHFGHHNTPTTHILANMYKAFPDTEETGELDIIFIEGDLFDRLLYLSDPDVDEIKFWMFDFLTMCAKRDIVVRVLEGTPSHDWHQNRLFLTVIRLAKIDVDFAYHDKLEIEYIERFQITILYIPDEWRPETDDTWREVCALLQERGLTQVDYAVMHGSFTYQLGEAIRSPKHEMDRYLGIVRKYIMIGHIHRQSQYDRILAAGSFDRTAHGEEFPKGHYRITVDEEHGDRIVFVENQGAQIYNTLDCSGLSLEEALIKLDVVGQYPDGSFVRIEAQRNDAILTGLDVLRKKYSHVVWSTKSQVGTSTQSNLLTDLRNTFKEVPITSANIVELIEARMIAKALPPDLIQRSIALLQKAV
jgi:hypothetical protein